MLVGLWWYRSGLAVIGWGYFGLGVLNRASISSITLITFTDRDGFGVELGMEGALPLREEDLVEAVLVEEVVMEEVLLEVSLIVVVLALVALELNPSEFTEVVGSSSTSLSR